ncbi:MAG: hypothetical protein P8164_05805 [Gammaproteobacteria bacterium]|jgi:ElaB/YqjD/DUF883 family membrane-anchored ribosome-binding protein
MADESIRKEMDALKADIAKLREDIVGLTGAVKGAASENVAGAKAQAEERLHEAWSDIERRLQDVLAEGKTTFNKAEQQVGEHPVGSVLTAFGIGFIIAKLLDVGGRR